MKFIIPFAAFLSFCSALPQLPITVGGQVPEAPSNIEHGVSQPPPTEGSQAPQEGGDANLPGLALGTSTSIGPINVPENPGESENIDGNQGVDSVKQLPPSLGVPGVNSGTIFILNKVL